MTTRAALAVLTLVMTMPWASRLAAVPAGTAFVYQGELLESGLEADGFFDFEFELYDAASNGMQVASTLTLDDVMVSNGIFSVELDFGALPFIGEAMWLEIHVRDGASTGTYNILDPRVAVRPAPYALYALGGSPGPVGPAGPAGPPGPPGDSQWQINGSATYYNDGFVGIGEADPLAALHVRTADLMLDGNSLFGEDIIFEGSDSILGMYSTGGGGFGSGVVLGEMSAGALVNKWAMVKRTNQAGDRLFFTFGTDPNYGLNPVRVAFHPEGYVAMGTEPLFFDTESTLTINTGTDQHGVLVYANAQGGSAIGLHAGPVGFSGVPKNAWFDGGMGGWNRYDVAMGSSKIETEPSGRMTLATAEANANPIQFENAMYLEFGHVNMPEALYLHSSDGPGPLGTFIQFNEDDGAGRAWSISRDTGMAGDALRVVYSGAGLPPVADTRFYIGPASQFGFNREDALHPIHVGDGVAMTPGNGAHLTAGGVWTSASSRTLKHAFAKVDARGVLERLMTIPITRWQYLGSDEGEHLGPVAEDFAQAFELGNNERYISSVDADGVALASIQGLYQMLEEKDAELDRLRADNQRQQAMMATLLQRIEALEEAR